MTDSGFTEIPHTADWALHVWAQNVADLFAQAAFGMYALAGAEFSADAPTPARESFTPRGDTDEQRLVDFLSELVYRWDSEGVGMTDICVERTAEGGLHIDGFFRPIESQAKEIKAVTHYDLHIERQNGQLETTITFDV